MRIIFFVAHFVPLQYGVRVRCMCVCVCLSNLSCVGWLHSSLNLDVYIRCVSVEVLFNTLLFSSMFEFSPLQGAL